MPSDVLQSENPMNKSQKLLGELLLARDLLSQEQLDKALDSQVVLGGRLGTNLVDLEYTSIIDLGQVLSLQHNSPEATPDDFMAADAHLLMKFPRELCAKYKIFPLRVEQEQLLLGMIDPLDQKLIEQLSRSLGMQVQAHVAPELRMLFFLEQTYGIAREKRFLRVPKRGETEDPRRRYLKATVDVQSPQPTGLQPTKTHTQPARQPSAPPSQARAQHAADQADEDELELVYLDDVIRPTIQPTPAPKPEQEDDDDFEVTVEEPAYLLEEPPGDDPEKPPAAELELLGKEAFLQALDEAVDRDTVTKLAVRFSQPALSLKVLFLVRGDMAVALTANPTSLMPQQTGGLVIPLSSPSLLQRAYSKVCLAHGPVADNPLQQVITGYLRADTPKAACVAPIAVGKRVINLLCVQSLSDAFSEEDQTDLKRLADKISMTYTRLIREKKTTS